MQQHVVLVINLWFSLGMQVPLKGCRLVADVLYMKLKPYYREK